MIQIALHAEVAEIHGSASSSDKVGFSRLQLDSAGRGEDDEWDLKKTG